MTTWADEYTTDPYCVWPEDGGWPAMATSIPADALAPTPRRPDRRQSMTLHTAARQALDALTTIHVNSSVSMHQLEIIGPAITTLRAALSAEDAQPVAWCVECLVDGEWVLHHPARWSRGHAESDLTMYKVPLNEIRIVELFVGAAPAAQAAPATAPADPAKFTSNERDALLWVLWHHQGGSSPVGQPLRYALGMGAHEHMTEQQIANAKAWAALTRSTHAFERDAAAAQPAATTPVVPQGWQEAERIRDLPAVDEALRVLLADSTVDNAAGLITAVLEAAAPQPPAAPAQAGPIPGVTTDAELAGLEAAADAAGLSVEWYELRLELQHLRTARQAVALTDAEIDAVTISQWGGNQLGAMLQAHRAAARAIERASWAANGIPADAGTPTATH